MPTNKPVILDSTGRMMANALNMIAIAQAGSIQEIEDWQAVKQLVRQGLGTQAFPIGTQLKATHTTYGDVLFDVAGHDQIQKPGDATAHTMTILMRRCIYGRPVDAIEALYYCETELAAGDYYFTVAAQAWCAADNGVSYQFTLTNPVPAGGQLVLSMTYNATLEGKSIKSYSGATSTTVIETATLTAGSTGTFLGTTDGTSANMNYMHRAIMGSNNYAQSALRQWINSSAAADAWWVSSNKYDRPVSYTGVAGLLNGFDADFVAALGAVDVTYRTNSVYELGLDLSATYTLRDKMFLPSRVELGYGAEGAISEGTVFQLYDGATNTDRIKYDISAQTTARYYWLRSPYPSNACYVRLVYPSGVLSDSSASNGHGAAPACVIY